MTIVFHDRYIQHIQGSEHHPESPKRLLAIKAFLQQHGLWKEIVTPDMLPESELALVHDPALIRRLSEAGVGALDPDTYMMEDTYELACLAASGAVTALKLAMEKDRPSFVFPRPPGHHAGPDYCGGFCYFNNVALAAKKFVDKLERVAIVDIDVHHGNGTNDIFYQDKDVLFISTHQYGIFPGTGHHSQVGSGEGEGYTINIPYTSNAGDRSMEMAFDEIIMKILREFDPGAILVSLGTDAHYNDPLASTRMSSTAYTGMVKRLMAFAEEHCQGRIVINLEGGYHVGTLAEIMGHLVSFAATGEGTPLEYTRVFDTTGNSLESIRQARQMAEKFWQL